MRAAACCEIDDDVVWPTERHFVRKSCSRCSCDALRVVTRDPAAAAPAKSSGPFRVIGRVAVAAASSSFVFVDALHAW